MQSIYRWIGRRPYSIARYNHPGRQDDFDSEFKHFRLEPVIINNMVGVEGWSKGHHFDEQFYVCTWDTCQAPTFMDEGIRKGWRLGVLGGQDNHHRQWGTANDYRVAVLATQLTREDIGKGATLHNLETSLKHFKNQYHMRDRQKIIRQYGAKI